MLIQGLTWGLTEHDFDFDFDFVAGFIIVTSISVVVMLVKGMHPTSIKTTL